MNRYIYLLYTVCTLNINIAIVDKFFLQRINMYNYEICIFIYNYLQSFVLKYESKNNTDKKHELVKRWQILWNM